MNFFSENILDADCIIHNDNLKEMIIPLGYLQESKKSKFWILLCDIHITLSDGNKIIVPKGMKTDLCSVPKFLWSLFPPFGEFLLACIVHDYLYIYDYRVEELGIKEAQKFADCEMLKIMQIINFKQRRLNKIYFLAVMLFGWTMFKRLQEKSLQYKKKINKLVCGGA